MMKGEKQQVTLLLAGSVGSGKSSVGNAILDAATKPTSRRFQVGMGSGVTTVQCKEVESEWKGLKFTIVDTPDCSHLRFEQHENTDEVERTAKLSLERATAIVFVIRVDERFTPTKLDVYKDLRTYRKPIIPVFTMKEKFSVDDILKDKDPSLVNIQTVLKDTGQTYVVFGAIGAGRSKENKVGVGKLFQILEEKGIIQPLSSVFTGNLHPIFGAGNTSTKTSNQNKARTVRTDATFLKFPPSSTSYATDEAHSITVTDVRMCIVAVAFLIMAAVVMYFQMIV